MKRLVTLTLAAVATLPAVAAPISILFVGNSYTFGRLNPVLTYNAANVRDLTQPQGPLVVGSTSSTPKFSDVTGTNSYGPGMINPATGLQGNSFSPHSQTVAWGGVPGIFKQLTVQAGLDYDVALTTRNAATLRGHLLNTANSTNWDLRGNIRSQRWDRMVLQEQSDEALGPQTVNGVALGSNFPSIRAYVDLIEDWVHTGRVTTGPAASPGAAVTSFNEQAMYISQFGSVDNCVAAGGTKRPSPGAAAGTCDNTTTRNIGVNANASAETQIYLQQTWARPNLINAPGAATIDGATGNATYSGPPAPSYFTTLEAMTDDMTSGMSNVAAFAGADGSGGIKGIIPVGQAFLTAVQTGLATRNMYAPDALTDGLIDLWFNDGTHASVAGSYLSALINFGSITGLDPARFGGGERAASDLGLSVREALLLQQVASLQLGFRSGLLPEPGSLALVALALVGVAATQRRARRTKPGQGT
jgi:hypothetical protein